MRPICKRQEKDTRHNSYINLVERICNEDNKPQRYNGSMESMLREFFSKTSKKKYLWKRRTFKTLLVHLYNQKCYALLRSYHHVHVLHNISAFGNKLVRDIEDWENSYLTKEAQISALLKHCFALYDTPEFMEYSFYELNKLYMLWYVQLGKGVSVKKLSQMPIALTNRMAHEFRHSPSCFNVPQALRYAQAIGFGATKEASIVIAYSKLSRTRDNEEHFWSTVVQFFSKVECIETNELDLIVDYLSHKFREDNTFSMKGRTFNALLTQTNEWHRTMYINRDIGRVLSWKPSGIAPLYFEEEIEGVKIVYRTIELKNSIELYDEGLAMQHCVAEYDENCYDGECAIFSLQKQIDGEPMERMATLEVTLPDNRVVQAKSKYNHDPNDKAMEMIDTWINNSTVRRYTETVSQNNYQPVAYRRALEREEMTNYDFESSGILRLILIILYLFFLFGRLLTPDTTSYKPRINYMPNESNYESYRDLDSILKAAFKYKLSKDSLKEQLKDNKWQNLN